MTLTERAQRQLEPYQDSDPQGILNALTAAFMAPLELCDVARETDTHIGWGAVWDPDVCPAILLPWLALTSGDRLLPSDTEQQQRERISNPSNFYRGSTEAIKGEIRPVLTGNQTVIIQDFVGGDEFAVTIITRTTETPDPAAVEAATKRQLAPWLDATYVVTDDVIWAEATLTWSAVADGVTWDNVELADVT